MAQVGLSEGARLVGRSRSTIHRAIKSGDLSATTNERGHRVVDTSELQRVFGALHLETVTDVATTHDATSNETQELQSRVILLEAELKSKDEQIQILKENLEDLRMRLEKSDEIIATTITQKKLTWFGSLFSK